MKLHLLDTVNLPEYAIGYLEYNDYSGLTDEDISNIDKWIDSFNQSIHIDYSKIEERYFSNSPSFGLPCTCIECKIYSHSN